MKIMTMVMAAVLAATVFTAQGATVGYYRFETENGTAVTNNQPVLRGDDSSGVGNHLTALTGAAGTNRYKTFSGNTPFPSRVPRTAANNVAYMGGSANPNFLDIGMKCTNFTGLSGKTQITVEAYIKKLAGDGGGGRSIVSFYTGSGDGVYIDFYTRQAIWNNVTSTNYFIVTVPGTGTFNTPPVADLYTAAHHVAMVISNTSAYYADYTFFVDGAQAYTTNYPHSVASGNITVCVGTRYAGDQQLNGIIDEVRISNTALNPNQFLNSFPSGMIISIR